MARADIRDPGPGRHHHWSLHSPRPATLAHTADTAILGPQTVILAKITPVFALRAHSHASDHWSQPPSSLHDHCLLVLVMWRGGAGRPVIPRPGSPVSSACSVSPQTRPGLPLASGQCGCWRPRLCAAVEEWGRLQLELRLTRSPPPWSLWTT